MLDGRPVRFKKNNSWDNMKKRAAGLINSQHLRNEKSYNLRSSEVSYNGGQENNFERYDNVKITPTFLKARIKRNIENSYYEL